MSLARRFRERHALANAGIIVAAGTLAVADDAQELLSAAVPPAARAAQPTLAQRKRDASQAISAAAAPPPAANDDDRNPGPAPTPYELKLLELAEDKRRLKDVKSIERKIELKKAMLPAYAAWCAGALQAGRETGHAVQDDVLTTIMVWRIDTGDYAGALELAEHVLHFKLPLPAQYDRDVHTLLVDEFADAALAAFRANAPFPAGLLDEVEILTGEADIHDQPRAKLFKARGLEALRLADNPPEGQALAGGRQAALSEARVRLGRALELDPRVGVIKEIERIDRELKKESAATPPTEGANG